MICYFYSHIMYDMHTYVIMIKCRRIFVCCAIEIQPRRLSCFPNFFTPALEVIDLSSYENEIYSITPSMVHEYADMHMMCLYGVAYHFNLITFNQIYIIKKILI